MDMIRRLEVVIAALLFMPAFLIGFAFECARPGFDTGRELANNNKTEGM